MNGLVTFSFPGLQLIKEQIKANKKEVEETISEIMKEVKVNVFYITLLWVDSVTLSCVLLTFNMIDCKVFRVGC